MEQMTIDTVNFAQTADLTQDMVSRNLSESEITELISINPDGQAQDVVYCDVPEGN